ncbi:MAG: hypothetical protein ACT4OZ_09745 [Gemmatimonadota bacterium]
MSHGHRTNGRWVPPLARVVTILAFAACARITEPDSEGSLALLVASESSSLRIWSARSGRQTGILPMVRVAGAPNALSVDRKSLVILRGGELVTIDLDNRAVVEELTLDSLPWLAPGPRPVLGAGGGLAVALAASGDEVVVSAAAQAGAGVAMISPRDRAGVSFRTLGEAAAAVGIRGPVERIPEFAVLSRRSVGTSSRFVLHRLRGRELTVVDSMGTSEFAAGDFGGMAYDPTEDRLFIVTGKQLTSVDLSSWSARRTDLPFSVGRPAVSPTGKRVVVTDPGRFDSPGSGLIPEFGARDLSLIRTHVLTGSAAVARTILSAMYAPSDDTLFVTNGSGRVGGYASPPGDILSLDLQRSRFDVVASVREYSLTVIAVFRSRAPT